MITELKKKLRERNQTLEKAREEVSLMKKENNFENINYLLKILNVKKSVVNDEKENLWEKVEFI